MNYKQFQDEIQSLYGKTIAVVYIFEGEDAPGFQHYHVWKSDVISGWLQAIQRLHCMPLIFDVRTFVEKAINRSIPPIDFVINLNCGSCELAPMGLIPSICGFLSVPCIPCSTLSILAGEDKYIATQIAKARGIQTPSELLPNDPRGIYRPLNFGSSVGVKKGVCTADYRDGTYQEFVPGFDITTPALYNPMTEKMELLPTVMISSETYNPDWFYSEEANCLHTGLCRNILPAFQRELIEQYLDLIRAFSIQTFCRIDARVYWKTSTPIEELLNKSLGPKDVYFLEINPMPSIRTTNNDFLYSFERLEKESNLATCLRTMADLLGDISLNEFLLANSMLSHLRAKCKKQRDYIHFVE